MVKCHENRSDSVGPAVMSGVGVLESSSASFTVESEVSEFSP